MLFFLKKIRDVRKHCFFLLYHLDCLRIMLRFPPLFWQQCCQQPLKFNMFHTTKISFHLCKIKRLRCIFSCHFCILLWTLQVQNKSNCKDIWVVSPFVSRLASSFYYQFVCKCGTDTQESAVLLPSMGCGLLIMHFSDLS